jgi:hypothetical protein
MVISFDGTKEKNIYKNNGSCGDLVEYLEKEGNEQLKSGCPLADSMYFFNHEYDQVSKQAVKERMDKNKKGLKRWEAKFYSLSINPSHEEIQHIINLKTGKPNVQNLSELTEDEKISVFAEFRNYTREVANQYAKNFNRAGVKDGGDLVYFARIETQRRYKYDDELVKNGFKKNGEPKDCLNLHVHVVVSRKDATGTISLCPLQKRKEGYTTLPNGKRVRSGFYLNGFKKKCVNVFSENYEYQMNEKEKFDKKKIEPQWVKDRQAMYEHDKALNALKYAGMSNGMKLANVVLEPEVVQMVGYVLKGIRAVRETAKILIEINKIKAPLIHKTKMASKSFDHEI